MLIHLWIAQLTERRFRDACFACPPCLMLQQGVCRLLGLHGIYQDFSWTVLCARKLQHIRYERAMTVECVASAVCNTALSVQGNFRIGLLSSTIHGSPGMLPSSRCSTVQH